MFEEEKVGGKSSPSSPPLGSSNSKLKVFGLEDGDEEAEEASDQADVEEGDREFDLDGTASPASIDLDFFKTCSPDLPSLPNVAIAERKVGLEGGSELAYRGITAESW